MREPIDVDALAISHSLGELQHIVDDYNVSIDKLGDSPLKPIFIYERDCYQLAIWIKEYLMDNDRIPRQIITTPEHKQLPPAKVHYAGGIL